MRPLHSDDGVRAPLLERLTDENPGVSTEPIPRRMLTIEKLAQSIEREVRVLLNTRCPLPEADIDYEYRSVVDYGLIDLNRFFTNSVEDKRRLSRHIAQTIAAYEPRLARVNVTIAAVHKEIKTLEVEVSGEMRFGQITHPLAFPVRIAPPGEDVGSNAAGREGEG
jgi:type VI secretion system protein ImpF